MTDTELNDIAAAAIIGESSMPNAGCKTPAAIGTPRTLQMNAQTRFWCMFRTVASLTYASPERYYGQLTLDIFFEGSGLPDIWPQLLALIVLSSALFSPAFLACVAS